MAVVDSQNKFSIDNILQKVKSDSKDSCEHLVETTNVALCENVNGEAGTIQESDKNVCAENQYLNGNSRINVTAEERTEETGSCAEIELNENMDRAVEISQPHPTTSQVFDSILTFS